MSAQDPEMTAQDVVEIVRLFNEHHIDLFIDGGWGMDALMGRQTRRHADLDIAMPHRDMPVIRALLEARGYRDIPRDDTRECNFVLGDDLGRQIDFHTYTFNRDGQHIFGVAYPLASLSGFGLIAGEPVRCISPEWMVKFHSGYTLDENDYHDVKELCQQFGFDLPLEMKPFALLSRLDEIGHSLAASGHALALIGLGSVGLERERLDAWSDLDFFVIVEDGHKSRYLDNLDWLSSLGPLAYYFRNTADGCKLLFQDGIFCEFAIFEEPELTSIPFAPGRIVWKRPHVPDTIATPARAPAPASASDTDWLLGEALTNLYVGMGRFHRGEKLSAARFIQNYAVDRILDLAALLEKEAGAPRDHFSQERRFEKRFPGLAQQLPGFIQGYQGSPASALAILAFLEQHFPVNQAIAAAIRALCAEPGSNA